MTRVKRTRCHFIIFCSATALLACASREPSPASPAAKVKQDATKPASPLTPKLEPPEESVSNKAPTPLIPGPIYSVERATLFDRSLKDRIAEDATSKTFIRLTCPPTISCAQSATGASRALQLDDHGPRPYLHDRPLSSLLPEDEELAPGRHFLSAALLTNTRLLSDFHVFTVVPRAELYASDSASLKPEQEQALQSSEACRLVSPASTVNGKSDLLLLASYSGIEPSSSTALAGSTNAAGSTDAQAEPQVAAAIPLTVEYQVTVDDQIIALGEFAHGTSALFKNAPAGDLFIKSTCKRGTTILGTNFRILTLNPELGGAQP